VVLGAGTRNLFDLRRVAVIHNLHVIARQASPDSYQVAARLLDRRFRHIGRRTGIRKVQ
jgi:hypothetical protein